ncbi:LysR family transcriptional regulator [Hahella ganghwensis]|uniref:LysR family transcriptional regulator n=1 Tax=Hahella ganghwensis TaxID=286420 RepID=UPI00038231AA|nr:LysR family transcriptional regulator [Hahella ganghwensis]
MVAGVQYRINANDLEVVLAIYRSGTLAAAGERLGVDSSTVFRALKRMEKGLGVQLFERRRSGYLASEATLDLVNQAESVELALEQANASVLDSCLQVSGSVKITTTDILLHGLVLPLIEPLHRENPLLSFEFDTSNQLANLTKKDADIAIRATQSPPEHLVGKRIGPIKMALYKSKKVEVATQEDVISANVPWVAPDEALPNHPSVQWRKKLYPRLTPTYLVDSILSVLEFVSKGMGVGVIPVFLARQNSDLVPLTDAIAESQTDLWLLSHPESRHLVRVATVYRYLLDHLDLSGFEVG